MTLSGNYYKHVISSDLLCPVLSLGDCYMCFDWLKAFEVNGLVDRVRRSLGYALCVFWVGGMGGTEPGT